MPPSPAQSAAPAPLRRRWRRWLIAALVLLALLAAYAVALRWVTRQIGRDVQDTLRDVPVLDEQTPRAN